MALARYLVRGSVAGVAGGLAFGLFVALVGTPLVAAAELFEEGHGHAPAVGHGVATATSVLGGVLFGLLLGAAVFGVAFYLFEPAIPGAGATRSYLLGAAGFVTVSGAPWLLFPPQPPGVEAALTTEVRVAWYGAMALTGALACGLGAVAYRRLRERGRAVAVLGGVAPLGLVAAVALAGPATAGSGGPPAAFVAAYRAVVVAGQVGLWVVLASAHAWLGRRGTDAVTATDLAGPATGD